MTVTKKKKNVFCDIRINQAFHFLFVRFAEHDFAKEESILRLFLTKYTSKLSLNGGYHNGVT